MVVIEPEASMTVIPGEGEITWRDELPGLTFVIALLVCRRFTHFLRVLFARQSVTGKRSKVSGSLAGHYATILL